MPSALSSNIDIFTANNDAVFSLKSDRFAKAVVRVLSWSPRKVTVSTGSKFPGRTTDLEFTSLAASGIVTHSGHHWTFQSDVELKVKDGRIAGMPQLLGIYLTQFTNNCGVSCLFCIRSLRDFSLQSFAVTGFQNPSWNQFHGFSRSNRSSLYSSRLHWAT